MAKSIESQHMADLTPFITKKKFSTGKAFSFLLEQVLNGNHQNLFTPDDFEILQQAAQRNDQFNQQSVLNMTKFYHNNCKLIEQLKHAADPRAAEQLTLETIQQMSVMDSDAYEKRYNRLIVMLSDEGQKTVDTLLIPQIQKSGGSSGIDWSKLTVRDFSKISTLFPINCDVIEHQLETQQQGRLLKQSIEYKQLDNGDEIGIIQEQYKYNQGDRK